MGQQKVRNGSSAAQLRLFEKALLSDIRALEKMHETGLIESGVSRIGAEQELFIVDRHFAPLPRSLEILKEIDDPHFTTELASFNMEFNLDPLAFTGNCLSALQKQLKKFIAKAGTAAARHDAHIILTGILPTLRKSHLGLDNMTPKPRYRALNEAMNQLRGRDYDLFLRGIDELYIRHDSVMLESCNTSFQIHFQVSAEDFARYYNIAQAVAGPVLASAVNSPLLFGRRLWNETRIAVFQQSVDTRGTPRHVRQTQPRVHFGNSWIRESVLEIFKEEIARFRILLGAEIDEDAMQKLADGEVPKLKALQLHNGTIYRWTRPCYGITDGKPHLRIENRLFPSGPSVIDEVANAAFWFGLIKGMAATFDDITKILDFDDVKANFYAAARRGLRAQFSWVNHKTVPAPTLVRNELLPIAEEGLRQAAIKESDIQRFLGIIKQRVDSGQTGSEWMLHSFSSMKKTCAVPTSLAAMTEAMVAKQKSGKPVHEWKPAKASRQAELPQYYLRVEQFMTTDLFTVNQEDTVDLVVSVMNWRRIRHLPVEDNNHKLVGLVTYRSLARLIEKQMTKDEDAALLPVSLIMEKDVPNVTPETTTLEAIALMRDKGVSCLPVVADNRLVGIITEHDFMKLSEQFLEAYG